MIESQKFTLESDFIQSYINSFIIKNLFPEKTDKIKDASLYHSCVNMLPSSYNLSDCSSMRDRVESFLAENQEKVSSYRTALSNCGSEILLAYSLNREFFNSQSSKFSERNFISYKSEQAEKSLAECVNRNLL